MILEQLHRLYAHMVWADRQVLELLRAGHGGKEPAVLRLFAHVLAAERVWLLRLRRADASSQPIWPGLSMAEIAALAEDNAGEYARYLDGLDEPGLGAVCTYENSQGVAFRTSVADVLTHVFMHGNYHRGQIAAAVRAAGGQPVNTDFITWVREEAPAALPL
jgi:uncharacterized damage-inducible protein DinB